MIEFIENSINCIIENTTIKIKTVYQSFHNYNNLKINRLL